MRLRLLPLLLPRWPHPSSLPLLLLLLPFLLTPPLAALSSNEHTGVVLPRDAGDPQNVDYSVNRDTATSANSSTADPPTTPAPSSSSPPSLLPQPATTVEDAMTASSSATDSSSRPTSSSSSTSPPLLSQPATTVEDATNATTTRDPQPVFSNVTGRQNSTGTPNTNTSRPSLLPGTVPSTTVSLGTRSSTGATSKNTSRASLFTSAAASSKAPSKSRLALPPLPVTPAASTSPSPSNFSTPSPSTTTEAALSPSLIGFIIALAVLFSIAIIELVVYFCCLCREDRRLSRRADRKASGTSLSRKRSSPKLGPVVSRRAESSPRRLRGHGKVADIAPPSSDSNSDPISEGQVDPYSPVVFAPTPVGGAHSALNLTLTEMPSSLPAGGPGSATVTPKKAADIPPIDMEL